MHKSIEHVTYTNLFTNIDMYWHVLVHSFIDRFSFSFIYSFVRVYSLSWVPIHSAFE